MNERQIRSRMQRDGASDEEIEACTDALADEAMQRQRDDRLTGNKGFDGANRGLDNHRAGTSKGDTP